ncbi:NAD(P)/FAD-dependent oxidoreductase [Turneriella parva]|uniref:FAD-dependent pyridine nucleotide-disulfide oxidoreductase n=1 Tax=Turneriella parva (strain ATCC BAA-1111 / DSM 21527 / NCTC 11395 / H) TaxID=869212 RepID=I4B793_TURPD|nr:FAD-dependent oxidoreductase [Turneriella parva]AFM13150.1 FAD-dependent pyridine nucleotide-disulfide oxidoreductase [Turneriella parva DSM 21527]
MSQKPQLKIAIVGGGYAGLAAAIELKAQGFGGSATVFDARSFHQKITQWHKLARGERAATYELPFALLSRRFHFNFSQRRVDVVKLLADPERELRGKFSAIIIAQGSHSPPAPTGVWTLDALRDDAIVQTEVQNTTGKVITIVGGGPTGVQFAFEFAARGNRVTLYEARDRLLPTFDYSLGQTAEAEARSAGIEIRLNTEITQVEHETVTSRSGATESSQRADHVLFVPGVRSTPSITCDVSGRVESNQHPNIFAAGDSSYFSGRGLNTKSAQAAVRKGQHVARSVIAAAMQRPLPEYTYGELGYFVSLGPNNAVGYLLSQKTAFSGRAALMLKEATERQYNLYLAGLPVYP